MISKDSLKLYNAYYYAHSLGEPYARTPRWMEFFSRVANRIVSDIAPTTVLDAGCALGMLVETLRGRGIQAWGFDISRFAIRSAHPNAKKYLWVGSIVDPLPHTFDLIVCVEVLEHLPKADSERALANLCAHTGDILFSSTPVDYKEATHFNVQQPEYWAALFARQGFYRDVDFDGTIITPWAARFRRRKDPAHRLIRDYERKYWPLWKENYDLRSATLEGQQELSATHDQIRMLQEERRSKDRAIKTLWAGIEKRDQQIKDLQQRAHQANIQLKTLQGQRLHRWADRIYAGYNRLFPPDSAPARLVERVLGGYRTLRTRGPRAALRAWHPPQAVPHLTPSKYAAWYSKHEPDPAALQAQRAEAGTFTYQPVISFITPVYNPPPNVLRATIESVLAQTYPHWELCLADGGSPNPDVQLILERYAVQDQRIRVKFLDENLGISGNTNAALELAQGEFV
ncbi:MAG: glycosyltransferase, partial [Anaerolineales bacterium]